MSALVKSITAAAILAATSIPALAAAEERNPSNLTVWMFLGICALIIIAQVVPMLRNIGKQTKQAADQTLKSETVKHSMHQ